MNKIFSWILNHLPFIIACGVFLVGLLTFLIKRAEFIRKYSKPLVNIKKISASPLVDNGQGGQLSSCYLKVDLINRSTSDNEVAVFLAGQLLQDKIFLPASKTKLVEIGLDYEKVKGFIGNKICLIVKDLRGKTTRKIFLFKSTTC